MQVFYQLFKVVILNFPVHLFSILCQRTISLGQKHSVKTLIHDLLQKGVIQESFHEEGEIISSIFICPKKNGKYRFILNLKNLNKYISY